ncbi:MAG TPA: RsmE family RNA methyltransferase [Candidatus Bathyarchaeia archaeon]|nr:RsmE family RNA methyltransferase [Candidatus Bathyarchaeia archaeon]
MTKQNHIFAFYDTHLPIISLSKELVPYIISDETLYHRLVRVLRLRVGESCVLFNAGNYAEFSILEITKKTVEGELKERGVQQKYTPHISFLLPLLKREALEHALYGLVQAGVNEIYLVETDNAYRSVRDHERIRLEHIMRNAAEQAKYFYIPLLHGAVSLQKLVPTMREKGVQIIFCDPVGQPCSTVLPSLSDHTSYALMIGPENDLTSSEKKILIDAGVLFLSLTPTILRAESAAMIGAAMMRAWFFTSKK